MANAGKSTGASQMKSLGSAEYKELTPPSCWTEVSSNHCLIVDLSGFRREEIEVEVNNEGHINISGERKMSETKYIFFQQSFKPPENSRPETARVWLEEGILYVIIAKQATEKEGDKLPTGNPVQEQNQSNHSNTSTDENDSENEKHENRNYSSSSSKVNEGTSEEEEEEEEEFHDAKAAHNLKEETILPMIAEKLRRNKRIIILIILLILGMFLIVQTNNFPGTKERL